MKKYTILVNQINWLDKDIKEADVSIILNKNEYKVFSHPCKCEKGKQYEVNFSFIESSDNLVDELFSLKNNEQKIIHINEWGYCCYGKILQLHPVIVDCGDIEFNLGNIINDENVIGEYVNFKIDRLDMLC